MFLFSLGIGIPFLFIFLLLFNFLIGGLATKYVVEYWGSYLQKKRVDLPFIIAAIGGLIIAEFTIPGAILTWLLSYVFDNDYY